MMDRRQIVRAAQQGEADVLVTLIRAQGGSHREPGARLLTSKAIDQAYAGSIGGGSLETEVVKKAASKISYGAVVERYSTFHDEVEILFGQGCAGTVNLLHEPAGTPEYNALMYALARSVQGECFTVVTWLPGEGTRFARALLAADGGVEFASPGLQPIDIVNALRNGCRWHAAQGGLLIERLSPPQRLVVLGAGDDARPLVRMAAMLGWNVIVADSRAQSARSERFPEAQQVIVVSSSDAESLGVSDEDAVVLMAHSYGQDRDWLATLLPIAPRYLAVLGAKSRSSMMVSEAAAMTGIPLSTCCERIHAPIGLDRLRDDPEAIALAVLSEAHARCMGTPDRSLRLSVEDVDAQVGIGSASCYSQARRALPLGQFV